MQKRIICLSLTGLTAMGISACSKSSSSPAAPTATISGGVSSGIAAVQSHVTEANIVSYKATSTILEKPPSSVDRFSPHVTSSVMSTADWTTPNSDIGNLFCGGAPNNCGTEGNNASPSLWVQDMLSPTFANSNGSTTGLMGRFVSAISQTCMLGYALGSSLPAAGTSSIVLTQPLLDAGNALCGTNLSGSDLGGLPATISVTSVDVSGQGVGSFDRALTFTPPGGGGSQTVYVKNDGNIARVMTTQTQAKTDNSGATVNYLNRYYAEFTASTGIARFEGLEFTFPVEDPAGGGYYFYRIWSNSTSNEIRVFGQNAGINCSITSSSSTVCPAADLILQNAAMLVGNGNTKVNDATFEIAATTSGGTSPAWDETGCINMSTGIVDTANQDATGACVGRTVSDTTGYALVNTTALQIPYSSWKSDETIGAFNFDDTTITSAAPIN